MTETHQPAVGAPPPAEGERPQSRRPISTTQEHEICADLHTTLDLAQSVLTSRDERVADMPDDSNSTLLRELRALGIGEAAPYLVAMVAMVDAAVDRLAGAGGLTREAAWGKIRGDVLRDHCANPDSI